MYGEDYPEFVIHSGVKQGSPLFPAVFNYVTV